uniref:Uncharacterized protein n=1 Tax=Vespula pensylvanica TaxID=30213 RepID=A0A834UAX3_VESPE|nr:hypothetical protein H0235_007035 [Vespula pensylvanica]
MNEERAEQFLIREGRKSDLTKVRTAPTTTTPLPQPPLSPPPRPVVTIVPSSTILPLEYYYQERPSNRVRQCYDACVERSALANSTSKRTNTICGHVALCVTRTVLPTYTRLPSSMQGIPIDDDDRVRHRLQCFVAIIRSLF